MPHVTSMEKRGIEIGRKQGIERGIAMGQTSLMLRIAMNRFGKLPARIRQQVESLTAIQVDALSNDIFDLGSLSEFRDWLKTHQ